MTIEIEQVKGSIRYPIKAGWRGSATYTDDRRCRYLLRRERELGNLGLNGQVDWARPVVWVGMNPSTATEDVDDPTVRRELDISERNWHTALYMKLNLCPYRATFPQDVTDQIVDDCRPWHRPFLRGMIGDGDVWAWVVAWGNVTGALKVEADWFLEQLAIARIVPWCLGRTMDGNPRHPVRMSPKSPVVRWTV